MSISITRPALHIYIYIYKYCEKIDRYTGGGTDLERDRETNRKQFYSHPKQLYDVVHRERMHVAAQ